MEVVCRFEQVQKFKNTKKTTRFNQKRMKTVRQEGEKQPSKVGVKETSVDGGLPNDKLRWQVRVKTPVGSIKEKTEKMKREWEKLNSEGQKGHKRG